MPNRRDFLAAGAVLVVGGVTAGSADAATSTTILHGSKPPASSLGKVGDFYIDTHTHTIYGPKRSYGWGKPTDLVGPKGSNGSAGYSVLHGSGPPAQSLGENNDFYIDTASTQLYGPKEGGVWGSPVSLAASTSLPSVADYVIVNNDGTAEAINGNTGNVDYSSSGDHTPVFQDAINALKADIGGTVMFRGHFNLQSQLQVPSSIALVGDGALADTAGPTANVLYSTYNGSAILVTEPGSAPAGGQEFVTLRDFALFGDGGSAQNGIEWSSSGGSVPQDTFVNRVTLFNIGQDGFVLSGGTTANQAKVWLDHCYCEDAGRHGINQSSPYTWVRAIGLYFTLNPHGYDYYGTAANTVMLADSFFYGSNGLYLPGASSFVLVDNCAISGNSQCIYVPAAFASFKITGNYFFPQSGATSTSPLVQFDGDSRLVLTGNRFLDSRGTPVVNHLLLSAKTAMAEGVVEGNSFHGSSSDAIAAGNSTGPLNIGKNGGYSEVKGKLSAPWSGSNLGIAPGSPSPSASTTYTVRGPSVMMNASGGTGVAITIGDPAGNTIVSGLATYIGVLGPGYTINFGAFTSAPTVYVGVM